MRVAAVWRESWKVKPSHPARLRDFAGLRAYLAECDIEGVVWHHPDGRMAKIKGKDFGLKRRAARL